MLFFILKVMTSAVIIGLIAELARRYELMAAALASLPLVSILAFIWIYLETQDVNKLVGMSYDIFWLVLPSLAFFLVFPLLLKQGLGFWWALTLSCIGMIFLYGIMLAFMKTFSN